MNQSGRLEDLRSKLCHIDKVIDQGGVNDDILLTRLDLLKKLHDIKTSDARDYMQKAKIQWAIEGDENSNFFHGIINRKRANLAIKGVMVDGEWVDDPCRVKEEFRLHFANRFRAPAANRCKLNYTFPNRLSSDQLDMLESPISRDEVRNAVWGCGENKSPGPDGFTFEFFRKFWDTLGSDFCAAVEWFFDHSSFSRGCNSSFIALIPKNHDPKFVNDYRPISLIGSLYKVVTKILATRLSSIISGLISDVQTAFLPNRQILDGPFIINELLSWCKHKKQQAMVFKVDFAKAYDSIRWDFLEDVLRAFGFGSKWCSWIRGCLHSGMASVLLNGSPTSEFQFHCGLKQGDPLAPYLFILIMESLHLSLSRAIEAGIFKGIKIGSSLNISHLFYADDAVFIGEWSIANLSGITHILHCFSLLSGLSINLKKSHLLGVGIRSEDVNAAALYFGCSTMKTPFKYLGVMVGGNSSTLQAWDDTIGKLKARLSNWKLKTLSVGGRLTLLKSVLGSTPIYNMSIYKVPKSVLQTMESIRRNFFNGVQCDERKIVWIKWAKVLASKKYGGLGVSSFYALNRALLFKWVWRFISRDNSLWCRLIMSMHGSSLYKLSPFRYSTWKSIIREVHMLKDRGVDLISHCHIRVGNGLRTQFWNEVWIGDTQLRVMFPRIYALEINKDCTVADKLQFSVTSSLRRSVRGGVESSQLALLQTYIEGTLLSNMEDRWVWDLNGEGVFRVKDVRILLDECFLPKAPTATRWVKYVPIKINVFAWKVFLDRLPTRSNLQHRGVLVSDLLCPLCSSAQEDSSHLFFSCRLATDIVRLVCRWWNLSWTPLGSYADWLNWFNSIRLSSKVKDLLEGVLYITWWSVWMFRNQLLFSSKAPRKDVIFDDIVSRSFTWVRLVFLSMMRNEVEGRANQGTHSTFFTNFPIGTSAKQVWDICEQYGKVVNSFIPARVSKEGKKFAFVRFTKVSNIEALIGNLNTVWIGKFRLRFNLARFQRGAKYEGVKNVEEKQHVRFNVPASSSFSRSFAAAVSNEARPHKIEKHMEDKPVMVIDDECLSDKNSDLIWWLRYLGGFWVSLEFINYHAPDCFIKHEGLDTWFSVVQPWKNDFRVDECVLWVDVEGIPLVAWTNKTFTKVAKRWGELLFTKDSEDNNLWRKRLCVVTKVKDFIMESFKIIIKGKLTVIRAREIIGWIMKEENDISSDSGDEESENSIPHTDICSGVKGKGSSDSDGKRDMDTKNGNGGEEKSDVPFGIYNLLNQKDKNIEVETLVSDDFSKPPGFSNFVVEDNVANGKEERHVNTIGSVQEMFSNMIQARKYVEKEQQSECNTNSAKGGGGSDKDSVLPKGKCPRNESSLLEKMNEFVEIGQTMGFSMEGCINDIEKLISRQGDDTGFEQLVKDSWHNNVVVDLNEMSYLKKKFQMLKKKINTWVHQNRVKANDKRKEIQEKLHNIDKQIDQEGGRKLCGCQLSRLFMGVMAIWIGMLRELVGGMYHESEVSAFICSKGEQREFVEEQDKWVWNLEGEGVFTVSSARRFIDEGLCEMEGMPTRWLKLIPIRVNVLAWRLASNKLPTRFNMSVRGLEIPSIVCPVCHIGVETTHHLFFSCSVASSTVAKVLGWWGLPDIGISSYQEWVNRFDGLRLRKEVKEYLE
ncbi:RNA-directed DNA polymerase, eukaryota, partial [Tanacetum coccineum]